VSGCTGNEIDGDVILRGYTTLLAAAGFAVDIEYMVAKLLPTDNESILF
jgi:hypothetical protein